MNKKLKELTEVVRFNLDMDGSMEPDEHGRWIHYDDLEKLTELIVRKCAKVSEDDITDGDACCTNTAYRIARQIKKHFGVEDEVEE